MLVMTVDEAKTIWQKIRGRIGSDSQHPLLIKTRWGIHTFFMSHPIDVTVLNNENRVVKLVSNLGPNKIFVWNPRYNTVVEFSAGSIRKKNIVIGKVIAVKVE